MDKGDVSLNPNFSTDILLQAQLVLFWVLNLPEFRFFVAASRCYVPAISLSKLGNLTLEVKTFLQIFPGLFKVSVPDQLLGAGTAILEAGDIFYQSLEGAFTAKVYSRLVLAGIFYTKMYNCKDRRVEFAATWYSYHRTEL